MENQERILLHEETHNILLYKNEALGNLQRANAIYKLNPFTTSDELRQMVSNKYVVIKNKLLENKEIKKIDKAQDIMKMEHLKWPQHVKELSDLLESVRQIEIDFTYLRFVDTGWQFDEEKFENYCDQALRVWAKTETELKKYDACKKLCDFLNELVNGNATFRNRLNNSSWPMIESRVGTMDFFPSTKFVKGF